MILWLILILLRLRFSYCYDDKYLWVKRKNGLIIQGFMSPEHAAAMWSDGGVNAAWLETITWHWIEGFGRAIAISESKIRSIEDGFVEATYDEYDNQKEAGKKTERF